MKRSWFGLGLLLALLAVGIFTTVAMDRIHSPMEETLNRAAESALAGDWDNAETLLRETEKNWSKTENFRQSLADHTPVEEVKAGFALLDVYCRARETVPFAACCADLAAKVAAIGEAHAFALNNLL